MTVPDRINTFRCSNLIINYAILVIVLTAQTPSKLTKKLPLNFVASIWKYKKDLNYFKTVWTAFRAI